MKIFTIISLTVLAFGLGAGAAADGVRAPEPAASPVVWCLDEVRALLARKSKQNCKGRIVGEDAAERLRENREQRIKRRIKGEKPLVSGRRLRGAGTGFFITRSGHVVTNHHVIAGCAAVSVTSAVGSAKVAEVIAVDKGTDLALLKAPFRPPGIAVFKTAGRLLPGDDLAVVGYPLLGRMTIKPIMVTGHVFVGDGPSAPGRFPVKMDIRRGNSGSPVMDGTGLVVGVISADLNTPKFYKKTGQLVLDVGIAIGLDAVVEFLRLHPVAFATGTYDKALTRDEMFARTKQFIARIGCWK